MDLKMQWTAFALMGLALVAAVGIGLARNGEMDAISVSMTDYDGMVQERVGYAITLHHYVDRAQAMRRTWSWQERRGYMTALDHWRARTHGMAQEALGWRIAAAQLDARAEAAGQEAVGWRMAARHAWSLAHALEREATAPAPAS